MKKENNKKSKRCTCGCDCSDKCDCGCGCCANCKCLEKNETEITKNK